MGVGGREQALKGLCDQLKGTVFMHFLNHIKYVSSDPFVKRANQANVYT